MFGQLGTQNEVPDEGREPPKSSKGEKTSKWTPTLLKMFESAATTFTSIAVLG